MSKNQSIAPRKRAVDVIRGLGVRLTDRERQSSQSVESGEGDSVQRLPAPFVTPLFFRRPPEA